MMILSLIFFILFVVVIGGAFFRLAKRFNKNKWLYFFIGLGCYYAISAGVQWIVYIPQFYELASENSNAYLINSLISFSPALLGILFCVWFHKRLEQKWKREGIISESDVLDDNFNS